MKIAIFSALNRESRSGNWVTASRWQRLLRKEGHRVSILHHDAEVARCAADVVIGLHARRSSQALLSFKRNHPTGSTMVVLTGTDLYRDLAPSRNRKPARAIQALNECNRIILLQPLMARRLSSKWRSKSSVVMMDVPRQKNLPTRTPIKKQLKACVVGHMRYEKDPLRSAMAVRTLPEDVQIEVTHAGKALTDSFHKRATRESQKNENWSWPGSISHQKVQQLMGSSDVLINSSRAEGAPNVLFEAIGWRLPVLASKIDGHVGILGKDYPGYFNVGDTEQLKSLLIRCYRDERFYQRLLRSTERLAAMFSPGQELKGLMNAIRIARKPSKNG